MRLPDHLRFTFAGLITTVQEFALMLRRAHNYLKPFEIDRVRNSGRRALQNLSSSNLILPLLQKGQICK